MSNYVDEEYDDYDITEDDDWGEDEDEESDDIITHIVMPDETDIIRICAGYGIIDWHSVAEYNNIKKPNDIKVGQELLIVSEGDIDG